MADSAPVTAPAGAAAPPAAGPGPIPRRQTRFRSAAQPGSQLPGKIEAFPVSQGIGPLIAHADGYTAVEVPRSGLNTVLPSYMNICLRTFLTNQKLSSNDKFLKEVSLYHPDALDLYNSFIFVYHSLRVRAEVGQLSDSESTLLAHLIREYPPSSLPVLGSIVDAIQTMTATENPYPWLGNIVTRLPDVQDFTAPDHAYNLANNKHLIWPNFKFLISQLFATAARARPTDATIGNLARIRFTSPGAAAGNTNAPVAIRTDSVERIWLLTPHGRVPNLINLRVAQAFHDSVNGSAAAPFINEFALDLPHMNAIAATANNTLASYMGLIDDEGVTGRIMRFRRWPTQLANMVATAAKYTSGSRYLSDIATTGLGALHHVARATATTIFEVRNPADVQQGAAAALTAATYASYYFENLNATLEVRDPVASDLSIQYQMLAQTNFDIQDALDTQGAAIGNIIPSRSGPFWDYAIGENGPESAVGNILMSHLPNLVRSNPRRDAAE